MKAASGRGKHLYGGSSIATVVYIITRMYALGSVPHYWLFVLQTLDKCLTWWRIRLAVNPFDAFIDVTV